MAEKPVRVIVAWKYRNQDPEQWNTGVETTLRYGQDQDAGTAGIQNLIEISNIPHDPAEEIIDIFSLPVARDNFRPAPALHDFGETVVTNITIDSDDTSFTVAAVGNSNDWGAGSQDTFIKLQSEVMTLTSRTGTTFTVTRGVHGTTAAEHTSGTSVRRLTFFRNGISHKSITLTGNTTVLDSPTIAVEGIQGGNLLTITPPTDTGNLLQGYAIYRGNASTPTTLWDRIPAAIGTDDLKVDVPIGASELITDTWHYRVKAVTKAGVDSSFSSEASAAGYSLRGTDSSGNVRVEVAGDSDSLEFFDTAGTSVCDFTSVGPVIFRWDPTVTDAVALDIGSTGLAWKNIIIAAKDGVDIRSNDGVGSSSLHMGVNLIELTFPEIHFDGFATQDLKLTDAGNTSPTEQAYVEVEVNGVAGFIRVYATK